MTEQTGPTGLPLTLELNLIDAEIFRLTKIIRCRPTGTFADKCRTDRDYQLDLRHARRPA